MEAPNVTRTPVRFGVFELDADARELRKDGVKVHLQEQPLHALRALVARPGEVVGRDELLKALWPDGTHVEFEDGLNSAIARLRQALGDSADSPRFIQTVPRQGYRFIAPVATNGPAPTRLDRTDEPPRGRSTSGRPWIVAGVVALAAASLVARRPEPAPPARKMLAVLPLEHVGDPPDESRADGLTDVMTTVLGQLDPARLGVIARTSAARYTGRAEPVDAIGRELGVGYVLEGSVRRAGERVRISVQLVETAGQTQLWAESYDRDLADVFAVERAIAETVARQLSLRLLSGGRGVRPPPHPDAHVAYLRGLHFWNKRSEAGIRRAVELFREAIDKDPAYARAHASLAAAYASLATSADAVAAPEARGRAQAVLARALEIEPELAEAHAVRAAIACRFDWNWRECEAGLRRTLALDPGYATAHHLLGEHLLQRGRFEEAVAELDEARKLDPLSPSTLTHLGLAHMYARRFDAALPFFAQASEIDPGYVLSHRARGLTLVRKGDVAGGVAALRHARSLEPRSTRAAADLGHALGLAGRPHDARAVLAELEAMRAERAVSAYDFAVVHAGLGDGGATLAALEKAFQERAGGLRWLKIEPIFDVVRRDPRFGDLLRRVGIPD